MHRAVLRHCWDICALLLSFPLCSRGEDGGLQVDGCYFYGIAQVVEPCPFPNLFQGMREFVQL